MIFSQRYHRALRDNRLEVELSDDIRRRIWAQLVKHDASFCVQRDPNDRWIDNTSALAETESDLAIEHGLDVLPEPAGAVPEAMHQRLRHLVMTGSAPMVFDAIEITTTYLDAEIADALRSKVNSVLELHESSWRFMDGEFFKLDSDFMGARLTDVAHSGLAAHDFEGAVEEFARARENAVSGEAKDAILYAAKSVESVLKVLTGQPHATADRLIKAFISEGFLDDLPEDARVSFGEQVLKTLPYLRNRMSGHGQGAAVQTVPHVYAELALQLAAAFHNFLIAKQLERKLPAPAQPQPKAAYDLNDDLPF